MLLNKLFLTDYYIQIRNIKNTNLEMFRKWDLLQYFLLSSILYLFYEQNLFNIFAKTEIKVFNNIEDIFVITMRKFLMIIAKSNQNCIMKKNIC